MRFERDHAISGAMETWHPNTSIQKLIDLRNEDLSFPDLDLEVPSVSFTRLTASLEIENNKGETNKFRLIGTTHELDYGNFIPRSSEDERGFIAQQLEEAKNEGISTLLVEQGDERYVKNNFHNTVYEYIAKNHDILSWFQSVADTRKGGESSDYDMHVATRKAHDMGIEVENFDLAAHPDSFKYIYEKLGKEQMLGFALQRTEAIFNGVHIEYLSKCIKNLLDTHFPDLVIPLDEIESYVRKHNSNVNPAILHKTAVPDNLREEFMAQIMRTKPNPTVVIAHTGHIIGVVEQLKEEVHDLSIGKTELTLTSLAQRAAIIKHLKELEKNS